MLSLELFKMPFQIQYQMALTYGIIQNQVQNLSMLNFMLLIMHHN